jgi:reactive chlorine resistance protein C
MELVLINAARRVSGPFLRISLAIILAWIGTLKFVDPSPVVGLLQASLPLLALNIFVYLLGAIEIGVAILMITAVALPYAGLVTVGLFAGTLTIFAIAPAVTGFPVLSLAGQFLLKDLGLMAAAVNVIAMAPARQAAPMMRQSIPVEAH